VVSAATGSGRGLVIWHFARSPDPPAQRDLPPQNFCAVASSCWHRGHFMSTPTRRARLKSADDSVRAGEGQALDGSHAPSAVLVGIVAVVVVRWLMWWLN
jgi:hypothetical protein